MFCGLGILALAMIVGAGASQDAQKDKGDKDKKEVGKVKGQLPPGFKDLGLSKEQISKIYGIQGDYNAKIADLTTKINELKKQKTQEEFKVLTDEQREKYLKAKGFEAKEKKDKAPAKDKAVDKKDGDKKDGDKKTDK